MAASLEVESTLTERYQTTVPETVRRALKLGKGDKVRYTLHQRRSGTHTRYRLFFRCHAKSKVIAYARVNDEKTRRAYESNDDAYKIFRKMIESGHPPDDWDILLSEARTESGRIRELARKAGSLKAARETGK